MTGHQTRTGWDWLTKNAQDKRLWPGGGRTIKPRASYTLCSGGTRLDLVTFANNSKEAANALNLSENSRRHLRMVLSSAPHS